MQDGERRTATQIAAPEFERDVLAYLDRRFAIVKGIGERTGPEDDAFHPSNGPQAGSLA